MNASTLFGNICLGILSLIYLVSVKELYLRPAPKGGDYAVGYAWATFILYGLMAIGIGLVVLLIWWRGGLDWVAATSGQRALWILGGGALIALSLPVLVFFKEEGPRWLGSSTRMIALIAPLLVIICAYFLLHGPDTPGFPSPLLKGGVGALFFLAAGIFLLIFIGWLAPKFKTAYHHATADPNALDSFQQGILTQIDTCDLQKNLVFLLVHTDRQRHPVIRSKALEKIKSRADWQQELVRRLDSGWAEEVFTFLASNEVPDPDLFPPAIEKGIRQMAEIVREDNARAYDFYPDKYYTSVQRILETADQYANKGVDFLPALSALRQAMNTRSVTGKVFKYKAADRLDGWIRRHTN